jgi:hypothetical protein
VRTRRALAAVVGWVCAALALAACGSNDEGISPDIDKLGRASGPVAAGSQAAPGAQQMPEMPPPGMRTGQAAGDGEKVVREGDVLERIHVPNYTYLRLRVADGSELWTAVPQAEVEVGAHVRVIESLVMEKFTSPSLDRTFDSIVFGVLEGAKGEAPDAGAAAASPSRGNMRALPPGHPKIGQ